MLKRIIYLFNILVFLFLTIFTTGILQIYSLLLLFIQLMILSLDYIFTQTNLKITYTIYFAIASISVFRSINVVRILIIFIGLLIISAIANYIYHMIKKNILTCIIIFILLQIIYIFILTKI